MSPSLCLINMVHWWCLTGAPCFWPCLLELELVYHLVHYLISTYSIAIFAQDLFTFFCYFQKYWMLLFSLSSWNIWKIKINLSKIFFLFSLFCLQNMNKWWNSERIHFLKLFIWHHCQTNSSFAIWKKQSVQQQQKAIVTFSIFAKKCLVMQILDGYGS
jgi:hypothetical protein